MLHRFNILNKIYTDPKSLANELNKQKSSGKTISLTNGCFDLIHRGHLEYLRKAAEFGHIFVVILNSDESVHKLKGQYRPIQNQNDRAFTLACIQFIDYVLISGPEPRLNQELLDIPIDIYVKGGGYKLKSLDIGERKILESKGCRFEFVDLIKGYSTSELIKKILMTDD